jgi:hypothetical protein
MSGNNTLASFLTAANEGLERPSPVPDWAHGVVMPLTPLPHQVQTLSKGLGHSRYGDYSEPGCMKTLPAQALAISEAAQGNKTVYMTKPTLVEQVRQSFAYNYPGMPLKVRALNGDVDDRLEALTDFHHNGWPDILIVSDKVFLGPVAPFKKEKKPKKKTEWESLGEALGITREVEEPEPPKQPKGRVIFEHEGGPPVNFRTFMRKGYGFLVSDDVVGVKTTSTQVHQAIEEFKKGDDNKLWVMNGTPVENVPSDAYGFIHLIVPWVYRTRKAFDHAHCIYGERGDFGTPVVGYKNLDRLHANLYRYGIRFTKKGVLGLPPLSFVDVPVVLSHQHKALYDRVVDEMVLELDDGQMLDFTTAQKMYQVSQQMLLNAERVTTVKVPDNRMLATLDDLVASLEGNKILIGAWYNASVEAIADRLHRLNPAKIYGGNTDRERETEKHKFINDPSCRVAVTNYLSGGVGIDGFQRVCSHAIAMEMVTVPGYAEQWCSRINRGGQENPMTVYLVVPKGTIAVKLRSNLIRKEAEANMVIGDKKKLMKELLGEV